MPEHILSGIKAIVAKKLKEKGYLQREIAKKIKVDRSMVSHYLHGRFPKKKVIEFVKIIEELPPSCGSKLIHSIANDKELAKELVKELYNPKLVWDRDKCLFCGSCLVCEALTLEGETLNINFEKCYLCGECTFICPTKALTLKRDSNDKS
ncbi:4Fe-4S binding protein [Methanocaldococcus infernus]|uniref:4Fe-4S ferredoxin iron-sulfur binding domain protein n=1 Tax=Methanocaldococcus infernus (strain DSM 11812 / JCM 15783 / ME) TaxID=573063 RepID=D5VT79_METIM|nr:4Fe-4S binding protein [Methanocaldococcus infernus]ADG13782.1 4Fe-4S ferredoxin iron-sulfur binding domain protein [Methanocaldococcus infernus ME]